MSLEWSLTDGILYVKHWSEAANAKAAIRVKGWRIEWHPTYDWVSLKFPCGSQLGDMGLLQIAEGGIHQLSINGVPVDDVWLAITGSPKPKVKPQMCPTHKVEPLTKEGSLWRCAGCDREAAPKAEAGTEERIAS